MKADKDIEPDEVDKSGQIAIRLNNVSKFYKLYDSPKDRLREALNPFGKAFHKPYYAVKNIDLTVMHGEVLGIVGRNGSGKSTLLKLMSSILTPSDGSVRINGKVSALLELGAGLNPEFTGIQNIYFYGTILGYSSNEMASKLNNIVEFADIGDFIDQPLKTYSSGMKSRLGFALAISVNPDILIVDEVLAVGDLLFQRKCFTKIQELFSDGKTVILVSHDSQAISQFCNRVVLLQNGELILDGSPKKVLSHYERSMFSDSNGDISFSSKNDSAAKTISMESCEIDNELYLDSLKTDPLYTNDHLAKIFECRILNKENKVVNLLDRDESYVIEFKVKYLKSASQISLGAQIKTQANFLVSGANQWDYKQEQIPHVEEDDVLVARWKFKCLLVPGIYVAAISSLSNSTGDLVKLSDALLFKVRPSKKINGGVVGLEQSIHVEKMPVG